MDGGAPCRHSSKLERSTVDVDSYNENYNSGQAIQMVLDFTDDIEELEAVSTSR